MHKAFELLSRSGEVDVPDVRYEVKVKRSDRSTHSRGVYLREPLDATQPTSHIVEISPKLKEVCRCPASQPQCSLSSACVLHSPSVMHGPTKNWVSA